ncbi:hypothetical protein HY251_01370, partial [bacterium]|nr:hypothetical protein [bacterium]
PRVAHDPPELLSELATPGRRALIEDMYRPDIAPILSELDVEKDIRIDSERGEERFLLVRRKR